MPVRCKDENRMTRKCVGWRHRLEKLSDGLSEAELESVTKQMNAMKQQVRSVQAEMDKLRSVHKLSREESDAIFELYDVDGNGTVDMHKLMQMIAAVKNTESSELNHAKIKQVWDSDGDGQVGAFGCNGWLVGVSVWYTGEQGGVL